MRFGNITTALASIQFLLILAVPIEAEESAVRQTRGDFYDALRQLDEELPTPNETRLASGAPGPEYWQQQVDYQIRATIDEAADVLTGRAVIRYHNNSPHQLDYLWLHLDQNRFTKHSATARSRTVSDFEKLDFWDLDHLLAQPSFPGGFQVDSVVDSQGKPISYDIYGTQMRLDLPRSVAPHTSTEVTVSWRTRIHSDTDDRRPSRGRATNWRPSKDLHDIAVVSPVDRLHRRARLAH